MPLSYRKRKGGASFSVSGKGPRVGFSKGCLLPVMLALVAIAGIGGNVTAGESAIYRFRSGVVTVAKNGEEVRLHFVNTSATTVQLSMWIRKAGGISKAELSIATFPAGGAQTYNYDPGAAMELRGDIRVAVNSTVPVGSFLMSLELMRKDGQGWRSVSVLDSFAFVDET